MVAFFLLVLELLENDDFDYLKGSRRLVTHRIEDHGHGFLGVGSTYMYRCLWQGVVPTGSS